MKVEPGKPCFKESRSTCPSFYCSVVLTNPHPRSAFGNRQDATAELEEVKILTGKVAAKEGMSGVWRKSFEKERRRGA
jgi:hypothetical protein